MEKQIEEMAKVYDNARLKARETLGSMNKGEDFWYAKEFYTAGYRKASEVAREIFEEIEKILNASKATHVGQKFYYTIIDVYIAELKKKYESEDNEK